MGSPVPPLRELPIWLPSISTMMAPIGQRLETEEFDLSASVEIRVVCDPNFFKSVVLEVLGHKAVRQI